MRGIRHIFLLSLVAATCAGAAEIRVRVIVPHTALHIRGDESSDVLGQASADQELLATGPLNAKWISVMPPDDVVVWIYAELVHDNRIITDKAQLRATAGLKGAIIGSVDKDTPVVPHGRLGDWLKIQSPLPLFISRSAIELATNAVSIRAFFAKTAGVATTTETEKATVIQTRHRVPETALTEDQILVYQVPIPEPLRFLEPRETETRVMHALGEYGVMHVKLYEDIARHGHIATTYAYPARVAGRYVMDPSPIPKFDNPKLDDCPALQLFGAGREKRIYAIPPYTKVVSLDFEDHPFERTKFDAACAFCGATDSFLDEVVTDDQGGRLYVCSDTDYCEKRQASQTKDAAE